MALTISAVDQTVEGNHRKATFDITFDSSYTTGGLSLTPAQLGLSTVLSAQIGRVATGAHLGKGATYDISGKKLVALTAANAEASNAADLSAQTVRVEVIGNG